MTANKTAGIRRLARVLASRTNQGIRSMGAKAGLPASAALPLKAKPSALLQGGKSPQALQQAAGMLFRTRPTADPMLGQLHARLQRRLLAGQGRATKAASDLAFQLGVLQLLKHAGVDKQNTPRLQASIMGFNKQAGAMLGRLAGKALPAANKGLTWLGKLIGRQGKKFVGGFGAATGGKAPAWMGNAAATMARNPRATAGVALGAGAGGLALGNREPEPRLPSGRQMPQGFYRPSPNPYAGFY